MKKNEDRFVTAIFCDDIRQEVGNKLSYIGCYQGELFVPMAPVALPKLCVFATVWTSKEKPFKSLTVRVVQDNTTELARIEIPEEGIKEASQITDETSTRKAFSTAIVFAPFSVEKPTMLKLVATTEDGDIAGPRLLIKVADQEAVSQPVIKPKTLKSKLTQPRTTK